MQKNCSISCNLFFSIFTISIFICSLVLLILSNKNKFNEYYDIWMSSLALTTIMGIISILLIIDFIIVVIKKNRYAFLIVSIYTMLLYCGFSLWHMILYYSLNISALRNISNYFYSLVLMYLILSYISYIIALIIVLCVVYKILEYQKNN
jgi:hypothetical protein